MLQFKNVVGGNRMLVRYNNDNAIIFEYNNILSGLHYAFKTGRSTHIMI